MYWNNYKKLLSVKGKKKKMHPIQLWDKVHTTSIAFTETLLPTPGWTQGLPMQISTAAESLLFTFHSQSELCFPKQPRTMITIEQTPAAMFLHTAHVKQISLLCYRHYTVYDNETFVFNFKSMVKWCMSHFRVVGWACYVEPCKISNKHSHVYHQNRDIFYYNQSLNDAVLYQISLQSDLGLAVLLQCFWCSEMVLVFHILSDSIMFPKDKSEALVDGNIAINKINHQMIYPLTFLGDIPYVFYELREHCPVNRSKLNFILFCVGELHFLTCLFLFFWFAHPHVQNRNWEISHSTRLVMRPLMLIQVKPAVYRLVHYAVFIFPICCYYPL